MKSQPNRRFWLAQIFIGFGGRYDVTVYAGPQPGGQLIITTDVENYPGL
jgi:thioredoxin reductase